MLRNVDKLTAAQVEEALEQVVHLIGYISDKDMFMAVYRQVRIII